MTGNRAVASIWHELEDVLRIASPRAFKDLRKGASPEDLETAQQALAAVFPEDVRLSYLIHDGLEGGGGTIIAAWRILPLSEVVNKWQMLKRNRDSGEFDDTVATVSSICHAEWWNPAWIPLVANGAGDFYCVDTDPGPEGHVGQLMHYKHEDAARPIVARSLSEWLVEATRELKEDVEDSQLIRSIVPSARPPTMAQLLMLVGRSLDDRQVKSLLASQPLEKENDERDIVFYCQSFGYDISATHRTIIQVDLYLTPFRSRTPFCGELIAQLNPDDGILEVRSKLGEPLRTHTPELAPTQLHSGWDIFNVQGVEVAIYYRRESKGIWTIALRPLAESGA